MVELPLTKCRSKCRFPDTARLKASIPRKSGAAWYKNAVPSKVTCPDCGAVTSWMSSIVTAAYRRPRTQLSPAPIVSRHSMISDVKLYGEEGRSSRQGTCARAASGQITHKATATPPIPAISSPRRIPDPKSRYRDSLSRPTLYANGRIATFVADVETAYARILISLKHTVAIQSVEEIQECGQRILTPLTRRWAIWPFSLAPRWPRRTVPSSLTRVHQLNSIFAIFRVSGHDKPLVLKSRCL